MGRCGTCRTQTQRFCFVHQEFVCDCCLVSEESRIHGRCVVNTYRKWVLDNSYLWPPKCPSCSVELLADGDHIRRSCMHVEHASCVESSPAPDHPCGACGSPLEKSLDSSVIGMAVRSRIKTMPSLQVFVSFATAVDPEGEEAEAWGTDESNEDKQGGANMFLKGPLSEIPRAQYERQSAALQIIETDLAQNVSQVSPEVVVERPKEGQLNASQVAPRMKPDTRISVGLPTLYSIASEPGARQSLSWKKEKSSSRSITSASMRRALKAGTRRWFDLRKSLFGSRRQVIVIVMFVVCTAIVAFLMSGDDREDGAMPSAVKPIVEELRLPHVRVNPHLVRSAHLAGELGGEDHANAGDG